MASSSVQQGTRSFGRQPRSRTTADSSESGQGSGALSDPYVAVGVEEGMRKTKGQRVKAPEGSARLDVRRSTRVASSRAKSVQASTSGPTLIKAPPGVRPSAGYQYEVLLPVEEQGEKAPGLLGEPEDMSGKVVDSRDFTTIQAGSKALPVAKVGRKRAATSEAPGASERTQIPHPLASAADFSPTHFDEPQSGGLPDAWQDEMAMKEQAAEQWVTGVGGKLPSPMSVEPRALTWAEKGKGKAAVTPASSPVVKNPFRHQSTQGVYRTRDADAAWSAAQGRVPPEDEYRPAGYTPVGGVAYKVVSPKARGSSAGRRLFTEYWGDAQGDSHTPQNLPHAGPRSAQVAAAACIQLGERTPLTVAAAHARIVPGLQGPHIATAGRMRENPGQ
jgi:hypothetical protein